jgi:3-hydroxyacyl-CoA dehydrogenase
MLEGLQVTTKEADLSDADLILESGQVAIDDVGALSETAVWISLVPGDKPDFLPPERFAQVHVGRPAHIRQIVELTLGAGTGDTELARVLSGFVSMGCRVIRTPLAPGMLESRLSAVLGIVGTTLMARGVPPELIDQAASKEGFRIGPCAHMDSVGLAEVSRRVERWFPKHTAVVERLRKIGDALEGTSLLDPEAASDVPEYLVMDEESVAASSFPKEQIGASVLAAVVSEAAALVGAGAVTLASDLDILMIRGFAYNADLGGPLFHADQVGVFSLYRTLEELQGFGRIWTPSADLRTMILNGDGFYGRLTFAQPTASVL